MEVLFGLGGTCQLPPRPKSTSDGARFRLVSRRLARQAPGAFEAALLERVAVTLEEQLERVDLVVFDTAPSGHTTRLVSLPESMSAWTQAMLDRHGRAQRLTRVLRGLDEDDPSLHTVTDAGRGDPRGERDSEIRRTLLSRQERFSRLRDLLQDERRTAFLAVLTASGCPPWRRSSWWSSWSRRGCTCPRWW